MLIGRPRAPKISHLGVPPMISRDLGATKILSQGSVSLLPIHLVLPILPALPILPTLPILPIVQILPIPSPILKASKHPSI